ncbi:MAG: aminopeptidase P N-terminal domain-containing protein [Candidatus Acidiferrales bacterium]
MKRRAPAFRFAILLAIFSCATAGAAQARFRQPNEEYRARRDALRPKADAPIVIFGYTGHEDASEVAVFFQEPNFYYLTGVEVPGAALLLIPDSPAGTLANGAHEVLYLPPRDAGKEKWEGSEIGPEDPGVPEKFGVATVEPYAELHKDLEKLAKVYPGMYTILPPKLEEGYPHFTKSYDALRAMLPGKIHIRDIAPALYAQRQIKSPGEIALLQKAIDLSVDAQIDAMRRMRPGLFEYQIAARMKEIHEWGGCEREAYAPIVGAGFNSTILHYSRLDGEIKDGDVVVIDVGGEYGGYAADITRTLPANGKFTPRQREIYEVVLGAQNAAIAAIKPGAVLYGGPQSLQQIAANYINTRGQDKDGQSLGRYFIHGVSHHLGLDVHDPGDRNRPLEPGMVVTVEPGIYIPEENLGVRIEDDVLVTADGAKILTARLPRDPDKIEKIMSEARIQTETTK